MMVGNLKTLSFSSLLLLSIVFQLAYGIPMKRKNENSNDLDLVETSSNNELDKAWSNEDADNDATANTLSKQQLNKLISLLSSKGQDTRYINQNYQQFKNLVSDETSSEETNDANALSEKDMEYIIARLHLLKKALKMRKLGGQVQMQSVHKRNPDSSNAISSFLKMYKSFSHQ